MLTINDAMCEYYNKPVELGGCGVTTPVVCPNWKPIDAKRGRGCEDSDKAACATWFNAGECKANPGFMLGSCPKSCGQCGKIEGQNVPAWDRGLALAKGLPAPPLRQILPGVDPRKSVDQLGTGGAATAAVATTDGEGAAAHHGPSNEHSDEHLAMGHDGRAAVAGDANGEAAGAHHGPSNEHSDEHLAMGHDGRAAEGAAHLRGRGAAGAAPKQKKARALREAEAKGGKDGKAAAAPKPKPEPEAGQAQASDLLLSHDGGLDAAAKPAAQRAPEEPASLLSSNLVMLWAGMLALCLALLARRVLPCCKPQGRIPKGRAF